VVRNEDRAKLVREKYPDEAKVKIAYGTASSSYVDVLEEEASKTNIILREYFFFFLLLFWKHSLPEPSSRGRPKIDTAESADDVPSAKAIISGILKGTKAGHHTAEKPVYWLHLSGTGLLQWVCCLPTCR